MPADRRNTVGIHAFVAAVALCGATVIALSLAELPDVRVDLSTIALAVLAIASAPLVVKVPGLPTTMSVSEVFVFTILLMAGTAAGTVTVAVEGLVMSLRQRNRRLLRTVFNVTEAALSIWLAGRTFTLVAGIPAVAEHTDTPLVVVPMIAMAAVFFLSNMSLQTIALALETGASGAAFWRGHGIPLAVNSYAAAALATLAVSEDLELDFRAMTLVAPLLLVAYVAYREAARRVDDAQRHASEVERLYTEARKKDEELRQAQKLEAIGRLAGGVAHDFNNMLTTIKGYGELLQEDFSENDRRHDNIAEILKATDRAAGLTRQLLVFSRRQVIEPRIVDLGAIVAGTERMLGRLIGEDIRFTTSVGATNAHVLADPGQIEQVLLNLAVNARDAMPDGGTLHIGLARGAPNGAAREPGAARYLRVSVSDTGCGIPEAVRPQIFDPFFTTKAAGRGTGLGLSTVHGIVQQAGGVIEVESEVGHGTTFHVFLPEAGAALEDAEGDAPAAIRPGTEAILLVEDEPSVGALVAAGLKRAGYRVLSASSGEEALRLAQGFPAGLDLLLTDVVMPGMNGRELAGRLACARPDTRVLFMSGYSDDALLGRGIRTTSASFIQKPFSLDELTAKVREALDAPVFAQPGF
ncbi:MAG: response regulator [Acidimicrobiia bacterium]|nr:response regulator [Acidimicrobiia bacterium]